MRKKYRKIFENLEEKLDAYWSENHRLRLELGVLEQMIFKLKAPEKYYIEKDEFEKELRLLRQYIAEVESKVSMGFYNNTGIYDKIRVEFSSQIAKNMNDIKKLEEKNES
jgi:hypothetical protein